MVRANSLLYAIYVCLIISILCAALLYIANLYGQLNVYYNNHEDLYIQNQSFVNYALANMQKDDNQTSEILEENGIESFYEAKPYGLLSILKATSLVGNDTVVSTHIIGGEIPSKTCIYTPAQSRPLSYSGTVKLIGDRYLPSDYIKVAYINNKPNKLEVSGKLINPEQKLPELSDNFFKAFMGSKGIITKINDLPQKESVYYNSFLQPTVQVVMSGTLLSDIKIKGNIIITSNDSIVVAASASLQDIILMAPKVFISNDFKGSVQVFATEKIEVGNKVILTYPSALCIYNTSKQKTSIIAGEQLAISGAIVLYSGETLKRENDLIQIGQAGNITGDIYCTGDVMLKSDVYGAVYAGKFMYKTFSGEYDNCIADVEINALKRPKFFVSVPLFKNKTNYAAIKKAM
ncbi:hypothetical protein AAEO56_11670 [Flavobacterium sp. DGU11]|uniref:Polymer-forming protein n=1 Tax=Flavobacterium arundinis TaxID=3139143 RepID=A0ABU9HXM3_9FLAO